MDQAQVRDRYHEEDYGAAASWPLVSEGYQPPHMISPSNEYGDFNFGTAAMSTTSMYGNPTPPMPQHSFPPTWPSMLANAHHPGMGHMASNGPMTMQHYAPQPLPPLVTTAPAHPHPPQQQSSSRRTLTDQDRRRMCQYHEEHPTVKQTEIGAMFGVERSTVSKVLRQKEKYLAVDDGSKSPIRRAKGKFPDIERALTNWALKHQQKGMHLDDDLIREKARSFAASVGNAEASIKVSSPSWLEKFKQKNQIGVLRHKKSSVSTSDLSTGQRQGSQTPSVISPVSPGSLEPSPLTPGGNERSFDRKTDSPAIDAAGSHRLLHTRSSVSLASALSVEPPSAFTAVGAPPMPAPYAHHVVKGQSSMADVGGRMMPPSASENHRRRSQTFPMLGIEASGLGMDGSGLTETQIQEMMASSGLDTPQEEHTGRSLSIASMSSAEMLRIQQAQASIDAAGMDHGSGMMGPPPSTLPPGSATPSTMAVPFGVPTLEEGRRGLQVAYGYLTSLPSGVVEPREFMVLNKLLDKLDGLSMQNTEMPGGMHAINVKKEIERKQSIQSL